MKGIYEFLKIYNSSKIYESGMNTIKARTEPNNQGYGVNFFF